MALYRVIKRNYRRFLFHLERIYMSIFFPFIEILIQGFYDIRSQIAFIFEYQSLINCYLDINYQYYCDYLLTIFKFSCYIIILSNYTQKYKILILPTTRAGKWAMPDPAWARHACPGLGLGSARRARVVSGPGRAGSFFKVKI